MGLGNFFSDFMGNKGLKKSKAKADAALKTGLDEGTTALQEGTARFDTYGEGGDAANQDYLASIGVLGPEAQARIQSRFFEDPVQNAIRERMGKMNVRWHQGRGMGNSGAAIQAGYNRALDQWDTYTGKLRDAGGQGFQARAQQAALDAKRADMRYGFGATQAGNEIGYGNALAQNSGINSLLKVGGLVVEGAKAFAPKPVPGK